MPPAQIGLKNDAIYFNKCVSEETGEAIINLNFVEF